MSLSVDLQFSLLLFVGHAEKAFPWCNARVCGAIGVVTSLPQCKVVKVACQKNYGFLDKFEFKMTT